MSSRRTFIQGLAAGATGAAFGLKLSLADEAMGISEIESAEDLFGYLRRVNGGFDATLYKQLLGSANEFKEGDLIVGVAAAEETSRQRARQLLAHTKVRDIDAHPPYVDDLFGLLNRQLDGHAAAHTQDMTLGELKQCLLTKHEDEIKQLAGGMSSDVIGCLVKLMSNAELASIGAKVFNPLPGSRIGAKGYLGARVQPNSPTDNLDDIRWQVFDAFAYAVGDVLLGTNPVSSDPASVAAVQRTLKELLVAFGIEDAMPHCVLAHIDVQAEVEARDPGSTALWFQSIAGCDPANTTFDISIAKMVQHASRRTGRYGLYFETGQGADFTNGHGQGFDMVLHESRKYGFARALTRQVKAALISAGQSHEPWVHLNDVAGFIGPEVFRTKQQLVRCCLEDIVMGKLHGLCIGLDVCSTLHMDVSLDDLDWCLDQIMPACPAYLMALPTKIDPMLGYLTTAYQDHVRLRAKFGYKVNDRMWEFFQQLGVIDVDGHPTEHFGDPLWVYVQYRRAQGDRRSMDELRAEGGTLAAEVRQRGVFIASGFGQHPWELAPRLGRDLRRIYDDAKDSIWAELKPSFIAELPQAIHVATQSKHREDFILHPESGEKLSLSDEQTISRLRAEQGGRFDTQIVISDGLNAHSIMDQGQLLPYLKILHEELVESQFKPAPQHLVVTAGRVRVGYRIGEQLFANLYGKRALLHIIGERPGTGHHTFSIYITAPDGETWSAAGTVDHNITKVVSGVATTALQPVAAAKETVRMLRLM